MSVVLLSLVKQRITEAAEDIFLLFERTIAEYEEELSRSRQENERHRKLLDAVLQPQLQIHRADVQQLVVVEEEVPPEQQEWSSSLDQKDPDQPPPHIKEEQEELWSSQEGEQLQGLEEADIIKSTFTPVPVKSEDDEEKPQSSQLHQIQTEHMETEADGEDCGGPARSSDPKRHLQPETEDNPGDSSEPDTGDSSEPDTEDSADWKETREPVSNSQINKQDSVSDSRRNSGEKQFSCSICKKYFAVRGSLKDHFRIHTGEKPFSCSVCDKSFTWRHQVKSHKCVGRQSSQLHQTQSEEIREAEPPASSSAEHMETEADGEDCGGPEPARNSDPERHLQPETEDNEKDDIFCSFSDVQQLVVVKEEVPPEQQEWSSSLDQEDPEPPPHIKEEQEELWISQEGEQLQGLEEANITKFTFTPVPVKSEDDEEKPQSSQLHHRQTEHMELCGFNIME
nr:zinc finger E-box-binding homeobox 1-like [Pseudochaenichthys georgianus]